MRTALAVLLSCCATAEVRALCELAPLEKHFAISSVVFVGRAISREVDAPSKNTVTTFEVEQMWKGSPAMIIPIRTCGAQSRELEVHYFCEHSITFQVGTRYLIFATGEPPQTSTCSPTGVIEQSEATLRWLADKPRIMTR